MEALLCLKAVDRLGAAVWYKMNKILQSFSFSFFVPLLLLLANICALRMLLSFGGTVKEREDQVRSGESREIRG